MRKTALTAFGLIGTDWVRMTAAIVDGVTLFVRADGTNAIVPVLPTTFRTSGDIANVTATLGHRVNMAAVPSVALPNHLWKTAHTLSEIADIFIKDEDAAARLVNSLYASYADEAEAAA